MFLTKVYQQWKALFWMIIFATLLQAFFMYKGIENVPFFLYHMFSTGHQITDTVQVVMIKNGKEYVNTNRLGSREKEMLLNNASTWFQPNDSISINATINKRFGSYMPPGFIKYASASLTNTKAAFIQYPDWWKRYYKQVNPQPGKKVSLMLKSVTFKNGLAVLPKDSLIFQVIYP